ncbi:YybH family protein [Rhodococcus koreensis]|uniref:SnoaL-like domain-containing protein n=1 Tax=Rhodococcus koreensis TaxID=99653 RepID=A0A1H4L1J3_9NOCA|nr:nuclear transport factor 2 family protein [Rhodococcus koreensis]SEB64659.1 SnoaL-like domain-containing protein [Rhodococcus koreensis]
MSEESRNRFNRAEDVEAIFALQDHAQTAASGDDAMHVQAREVVMADLFSWNSPEGWYQGWEEQWANMNAQFEHTVPDLIADMQDMTYVSNGQIACLSMHVHATAESSGTNITFRELDTFRKTKGGKWLLTTSHVSFPVDRETGRGNDKHELPQRGAVEWSADPLPGPATTVEKAQRELRQWFESRIVAQTADEAVTHFAAGEDVVYFGPFTPGVCRGLDEVRTSLTELFAGVSRVDAEITDFIAHSDGELGSVLARVHLTVETTDGSTQTWSLRHSDCLRRNGDHWETLMEEMSFVVDVKSRAALTDLRAGALA